jgi:hypothetical protein
MFISQPGQHLVDAVKKEALLMLHGTAGSPAMPACLLLAGCYTCYCVCKCGLLADSQNHHAVAKTYLVLLAA